MGIQDRDWYREELRRKEDLYYNPKSFRRPRFSAAAGAPPSRPAGGLSLFVLVLVVVAVLVSMWRSHDPATRRERATAEQQHRAQLEAVERARLADLEQAARLERLRQEQARRQSLRAAQEEATSRAAAAASEEGRRRAQLWERFYRPDPSCERSASVECANAFIRARRRFDELYPPYSGRAGGM